MEELELDDDELLLEDDELLDEDEPDEELELLELDDEELELELDELLDDEFPDDELLELDELLDGHKYVPSYCKVHVCGPGIFGTFRENASISSNGSLNANRAISHTALPVEFAA